MSLHFFNIKWQDVDDFLKDIGLMTAQTSHKWATVFVKGDYEEFSNDSRGGKHTDSFYDIFPEIEAYYQGQTYADVLKLFFSQLCKTTIQSHRRISNKNINEH